MFIFFISNKILVVDCVFFQNDLDMIFQIHFFTILIALIIILRIVCSLFEKPKRYVEDSKVIKSEKKIYKR